ncbi:MAG TPA: MarR family transcriptional regulator [Mycobacteriales bacterium]|nr:MarR family transcriptional regulator [Mycobacteriales bacterium]
MPAPARPPVGRTLARTAKVVSRAFDDALTTAGGSLPIWLIMISLRTERSETQRELAEAVGIKAATLTHHLNAMEADGLVVRRRKPDNRRVHDVQLSDRGEALFHRLAAAAVSHDRRLRAGLSDDDLATLDHLLDRLRHNVADPSLAEPLDQRPA